MQGDGLRGQVEGRDQIGVAGSQGLADILFEEAGRWFGTERR